MRSILLGVALVACLAAVPVSHAVPAAAPSLRLVTFTPLTLRGSGFRPRERVRLILTVRRLSAAQTLRADARGRFTYRPRTLVALDPCRGTIVVTAAGSSSGRRATWKRPCRPPDPLP